MKVGETDVFQETQALFIERFNNGKSIKDVILEIQDRIASTDELSERHEMLFALAECIWLCGEQDDYIFKEVFRIIKSRENINLLVSMGLSQSDVSIREKELERFAKKLLKKRPVKNVFQKRKVELKKGDVFSYAWKNVKKGCGIVLDVIWVEKSLCYKLIALSAGEDTLNSVDDVLRCKLKSISWYSDDELLSASKYKVLGNISITAEYNGRAGFYSSKECFYCSNMGSKRLFELNERLLYIPDTVLEELLDSKRLPKTRVPERFLSI